MTPPRVLLKAAKRSHGELKREVMKACNLIPGVYVFPAGAYSGRATYKGHSRFIKIGMVGTADLLGVRTSAEHFGQFIALECKTGKDALRPEQVAFLDTVRKHGGIALEVRSVEQAVEALR